LAAVQQQQPPPPPLLIQPEAIYARVQVRTRICTVVNEPTYAFARTDQCHEIFFSNIFLFSNLGYSVQKVPALLHCRGTLDLCSCRYNSI
jgi:hypothetical protein